MSIDTVDITVPAVIGVIGTLLTAIATRASWSDTVKRFTAIGVTVAATLLVGVFTLRPDAWATVATWLGVAIATLQVAYSALKPTGVLDWVRDLTTPSTTSKK